MKATLLIRCLNEINNLKILFPILEAQEDPNFEIVFIDSGSTDGSYEYVKNYDSKIPIILAKIDKAEFSFGKSLNMAAEKSTYKNILISLSAHCFPTDNLWFKNIISDSVVTHYHNEDTRQIRNRYRRESQALRNIFIDDIEFSILDLVKNTFKETYSDIQFKKENIFPKSNLYNILKYRYNKNLGHYMGINHPLASTKVIQNNYYSYSDSKIYIDNFKKDYFYK